jgi:formate hydrogenlyase subunit 3/multisubunit Na+/H+ antiporter MnhD subunit
VSVLPLVVVTAAGALAVVLVRGRPRLASAVGLTALVLALVAAVSIPAGGWLSIAGEGLVVTPYGRLALVVATGVGALLGVVAVAGGSAGTSHAAALAALAAAGLAIASTDVLAATWAVAAGSVAIVAVGLLLGRGTTGTSLLVDGLRAVVLAGAAGVAGVAVAEAGQPRGTAGADTTLGSVAFLGVAFGLGLRSAAVPLHGWAARLADAVPRPMLAPMLAWLPAVAAVVALAWSDVAAAPLAAELGPERVVVVAVAIATVGLGTLAAWIQEDAGHAVVYVVIAGAGVSLLGLSVIDPAAWAPTRTWVVIWLASATGLVGWVAALESAYGTRRLPELGGWARRSPALAVSLAALALATVGLPSLVVAEARMAVVDAAIEGLLGWPVRLLLFVQVAPLLAALVVGLRPISGAVADGASEWPGRADRGDAADQDLGSGLTSTIGDVTRTAMASIDAGRATIASTAVVAIAAVALLLAFGGMGLTDAAAGPPPGLVPVPSVSGETIASP